MTTAYAPSNAGLILRVPVSAANKYGVEHVTAVPTDTPCWVTFGGELTYTDQGANSYAKLLDQLMQAESIRGVNVYSVRYEFRSLDSTTERKELFRAAGRKIPVALHPNARQRHAELRERFLENEPNPNYVKKLVDILLRPRFADKNGAKLPVAECVARMRRIKFWAHCHGAATIYQMANVMNNEMRKMGYATRDIAQIQRNVLVIQFAPIAPLNAQRFTTLTFASADDTALDHYNAMSEWIHDNSENIVPAYVGPRHGNMFVAGQLKLKPFTEHDHNGMLHLGPSDNLLTESGHVIFSAMRNAIVNGTRQSLSGGEIPSVGELVGGNGVDFDDLEKSGRYLYNLMLTEIQKQNPTRGNQK